MRKKSNNLSGAKGRLLEYLDSKGVKNAEFYRATNLSNGFLDKNNNIGSDSIELIISKYQDLSLGWLITGEGEMLVKKSLNSDFVEKILEKFSEIIECNKKEHTDIIAQNGEIVRLNGEIIKQNSDLIKQNSNAIIIIQNLSEKLK